MSTYTCPHCGERGLSTQRRHWCPKAPPISQLLRLGPPRSRDPIANEYIARLTLDLEEAREREQRVRSAVIRAVAALVRLDLRWDPREETEWVRRESVVGIAVRLKDEVLALSTLQEVNDV